MVSPVEGGIPRTPDASKAGRSPTESLPNVSVGQILGLLSILRDEPDLSNVYRIADEVGREFGETLALVKAAEMLELVETPKHDVLLTPTGRRFLESDPEVRRELFRKQIRRLRLFQRVEHLLPETGGVQASGVVREIGTALPHENPERIFQTLVAWGRYAGLLDFDADAHELSAVHPGPSFRGLGGDGGRGEKPEG